VRDRSPSPFFRELTALAGRSLRIERGDQEDAHEEGEEGGSQEEGGQEEEVSRRRPSARKKGVSHHPLPRVQASCSRPSTQRSTACATPSSSFVGSTGSPS